jgi:hypothetical protein
MLLQAGSLQDPVLNARFEEFSKGPPQQHAIFPRGRFHLCPQSVTLWIHFSLGTIPQRDGL